MTNWFGYSRRHPAARVLWAATAASLAVLGLAACSGSSASTGAAGGRHYSLQVGAPDPADEATTAAVTAWAKQVKQDTGGAVDIVVHANDELGSDATQLSAVQTGNQFGFAASEGDFEGLDPIFSIPDLPYMFPKGADQEKSLLGGKVGDTLSAKLEQNKLVNVGWFTFGPRDILSKSPVTKPGEVNDLKIRVQPAPSMESGYQQLGAAINPVSFDELYTALSTGVVDAMENSPSTIYAHKFYETAKTFSPVEMIQTAGALVVSKQVFDTLPAKYQKVLIRDGTKAMGDEWSALAKTDDEDLGLMKKAGVTVEDVDVSAWQDAVGDAGEKFAKKKGGATYELYQTVKSLEQ